MPFVARWPGKIHAGATSSHPTAFWDFLPTACELAGISPAKKTDGISFLPTLLGNAKEQEIHPYLYWEFNEGEGPLQAILMEQWKGIKKYEVPFELYNLEKDPGEQENMADQHPEVVNQIEKLLSEARTDHPEFPLTKRKMN
jgi:arylsulfatase A-like enzyme